MSSQSTFAIERARRDRSVILSISNVSQKSFNERSSTQDAPENWSMLGQEKHWLLKLTFPLSAILPPTRAIMLRASERAKNFWRETARSEQFNFVKFIGFKHQSSSQTHSPHPHSSRAAVNNTRPSALSVAPSPLLVSRQSFFVSLLSSSCAQDVCLIYFPSDAVFHISSTQRWSLQTTVL